MDPRTGLGWMLDEDRRGQLGQFSMRSARSAQVNRFQAPLRISLLPDQFFALFPGMTISVRVTGNRAEVYINERYKIYDGSWSAIMATAKQSTCPRWTVPYGTPVCDGSLLLESALGRAIKIGSAMNLRVPAYGFLG